MNGLRNSLIPHFIIRVHPWPFFVSPCLRLESEPASRGDPATSTVSSTHMASYTNPIAQHGADPWVIFRNGVYYYCFSRDGAVWISSSRSLLDVFAATPVEAWRPEKGHAWSEELWAPELHWLEGAWWIYVAADDGDNHHHRMQALCRRDASPVGMFERVGTLALPDDKWAIDGTALVVDGQLYHVWSGWPGDENVTQNTYLCRMADPATPIGPRALISKPELDWELRGGNPSINEGATALYHDGRTFIVYSASGSWSDFYCLGLLELVGSDPMDPASWKKHARPVFESGNGAIAPGHASFTTSKDGAEHWIVYHTARHAGAGWDRVVNLQRFSFDKGSGLPVFGAPAKPGDPLEAPK